MDAESPTGPAPMMITGIVDIAAPSQNLRASLNRFLG
jgi:hypothetical protein